VSNNASDKEIVGTVEKNFTPREVVSELDRFIIGQSEAKRAVAVALRNRWRRRQVPAELRDEITPKNIIMIGPTGVGKTEIARRLAKLANAPFVKVEASKFTEVGYVGKDVESMIRELTEVAVKMVKEQEQKKVKVKAAEAAEERMLDLLLPGNSPELTPSGDMSGDTVNATGDMSATREKLRKLLREGKLDDRYVEIQRQPKPVMPGIEVITAGSIDEMSSSIKDMFSNLFSPSSSHRRMRVPEAMEYLMQEEAAKLIDMDAVAKKAIALVEQDGIVFLDEIDKIASQRGAAMHGPDVSREGVQRDILPIVEGSTVTTKYGIVRTDHILFIAAGAFLSVRPSDLIPELQGRFPIRVELHALSKSDFERILKETDNSLIKQYTALMSTEGIELEFSEDAISEVSGIAAEINEHLENIGARRLHTVMEKLLEEISFNAPEMGGGKVTVNAEYVRKQLSNVVKDRDLRRYIL